MSRPYNFGCLNFDRPLEDGVIRILSKLNLYDEHIVARFKEGEMDADFDEYTAWGSDIEHDISLIVIELKHAGYTVNGHIWTEGTANDDWNTTVANNVVSGYESVDAWKTDESDETIIEVLESRGYEIRRKA